MTLGLWVVDTNVLVAALLTAQADSPTARTLDAMLDGSLMFLLSPALLAEYRRQLRAESIALTPLRRIYVLGAVARPGVYMMDPTFELRGIVSMAGGATTEGALDHVRILRDGATVAKDLSLTQTALDFGVRSGDQIFVDRRSWADRNSALLLSSFLSLAGVVGILVQR
jgi:polysaccharide export outer membrane protein